jgi:hypothetical protein
MAGVEPASSRFRADCSTTLNYIAAAFILRSPDKTVNPNEIIGKQIWRVCQKTHQHRAEF